MQRFFRLVNGSKMPSVGLGTFQMKGDVLKEAVDYAISVGYRHIDTAVSYGNECDIGEVLSDRIKAGTVKRKDLFVTSKVPRTNLAKKDMKECAEKSLEELRLTYLDMFLIHHPWQSVVRKDNSGNILNSNEPLNVLLTWRALEGLCAEKLVSNIGVSNFTKEQINSVLDIQKIPLSNVQLESHVYYQQKNLKRFCDSKDIVVSAYAPLGAPNRPIHHVAGNESVLDEPLVNKISAHYKKTPAQVLLNFVLRQGMAVLPKSSCRERIAENFDCLNWCLTDDDYKAIQDLDRGIRFFKFIHMDGHPDYFRDKEF